MVDATVSFAIEKPSNFLIQEVNIRIGVKDALRWLKDELGYLQSWVKDAEGTQETDPRIALWINSIRDVSTDSEIILERISVIQKEHAANKQSVMDRLWSFICMCNKEANLYEIGKEIESLKGRVVEIKKRRDEYNIAGILADPNLRKRKRTLLRATSFENQVDVVGFDDDYRTLLAELVKEDPTLNVISIHGMGGLGKTTIASKLYHSSELSQFRRRAWVCVSEDYNIKDVLRKIIKSLMGHEVDLLDKMDEVEYLLRKLQNLLQDGGRYLAVIDDVWDINVWEKIKKAFPDKKNGSRVIITTRNKEIAQRVDDRCFVHQLRFLTDDESWELFCKRAKPTENQEKLGKEMVSKCRGLPLAIVVLSGLLLHKNWEDVKDHLWRNLKGDSMEIQEILSLSYNDLSFRTKQCFLYLSRFPEDCEFNVKDLMLLWIAEEFITEADEGDGIVLMEDLAKDYLHELLNRNMIQVQVMGLNGEVLKCRLHDLVRELAIQKAKENKLLGIFDSTKVSESPNNLLQGQPRHAIYKRIGEYLKSIVPSSDDLRLRSLAVVKTGFNVGLIELEEMKLMFTRFTYLKVLDLRYVESGIIPEEIGDLVLLKFLGLVAGGGDDYDDLKGLVIPPTIGKLKMLQTLCSLDKHTKYNYPREIYKLEELRHINIWKYEGDLSMDSSHQTKLQTLYNIWSKDWMNIDTVNFSNLHTLSLVISGNADNSLDSMANLIILQTLYLSCRGANVMPTMKPLLSCKRLKSLSLSGAIKDPSELQSIPDSVMYLGLFCCELTQDPMPTLESLSNLTTLILCYTYGGEKMVCSNDGFPGLQFLVLQELHDLKEFKVEEGALSSLKGLTIENCYELNMVFECVKCIPRIPALYGSLSFLVYLRCVLSKMVQLRSVFQKWYRAPAEVATRRQTPPEVATRRQTPPEVATH